MAKNTDLPAKLTESLPPEVHDFLKNAGARARELNSRLFLVGGGVRDILLDRAVIDLDLLVEGDAIHLARSLAENPDDLMIHHRFSTARLKWNDHIIDIARSRQETYARPGVLPVVRPGSVEDDLARRDFSVNAMAISLNHDDWGRLFDRHGGQYDLEHRCIRVLHPASFIDDATRLWRAIRYEQRLGFDIEPKTLALFRRDLPLIESITPDRQRYELECVLGELEPEKVFWRACELGLLRYWHPALQGDKWLTAVCNRARAAQTKPGPEVYLALLGWRLAPVQKEELIAGLRLTRRQSRTLHDSSVIIEGMPLLASPNTAPSRISGLLRGLCDEALFAGLAAIDSETARCNITRFMKRWRDVVPELTGEDLKLMGVPQGPEIKRLLDDLRDRRLDGAITNRGQEESIVRDWCCIPRESV
ncbi:CCA tRNA nucleotidyltransferase [Dehalogenimonas sp. THU2]|uniref:CCA tRNA nucleotidyltransferase n=1 Tax=Dehalogenimonas sp. THU2 TaxID=3151121 RepID=UPI00321871E0